MRTDVKIGLICGLVVAGSAIAYFAWPTHAPKTGLTSTVPPIVEDHASSGPVIVGAATPAAPSPILGPTSALAAAAPTTAPATYPASVSNLVPANTGVTPAPTAPGAPLTPGSTLVLEPENPGRSVPGTPAGTPGLATTGLGLNPPGTTLPAPGSTLGGPATPPAFGPTPPALGTGGIPTGPTLQLENTANATTYVVKAGDSFGKIAHATYGNQKAATLKAIEQANPGVDSRHLKIGQKLNLPALPTTAGTPAPTTGGLTGPGTSLVPLPTGDAPTDHAVPTTRGAKHTTHTPAATAGTAPLKNLAGTTYTVKKGDDLRKIARAVYGDERRWRQIARANRGTLADPDDLEIGMELKLPPQ